MRTPSPSSSSSELASAAAAGGSTTWTSLSLPAGAVRARLRCGCGGPSSSEDSSDSVKSMTVCDIGAAQPPQQHARRWEAGRARESRYSLLALALLLSLS